jgi:hypothetical protein
MEQAVFLNTGGPGLKAELAGTSLPYYSDLLVTLGKSLPQRLADCDLAVAQIGQLRSAAAQLEIVRHRLDAMAAELEKIFAGLPR